jgi:2,3-dihydroxybiphenyl 1,2-dioxygenase
MEICERPGSPGESIFNRVSMGYAVVETSQIEKWQTFLRDGIGIEVTPHSDTLRCRLDDHQCRLLIKSGKAENVVALGLEMADEDALQIVLQRLKSFRITAVERTGPEAHQRGVKRFWSFKGPKGLTVECYANPVKATSAPKMVCQGFVTGDQGFGHIAMVTKRPDEVFAFWRDIFDIRHTDDVQEYRSGAKIDLQFLRFNRRHHSIALASTPKIPLDPIRTSIQHLEVQMVEMDEVSKAYERCKSLGFHISMSVGQHANDRAVSFYVRTPSGFDIECGWNPLTVQEEDWKGQIWDTSSIWGHQPEGRVMSDFVTRLTRALSTATRQEEIPIVQPALDKSRPSPQSVAMK